MGSMYGNSGGTGKGREGCAQSRAQGEIALVVSKAAVPRVPLAVPFLVCPPQHSRSGPSGPQSLLAAPVRAQTPPDLPTLRPCTPLTSLPLHHRHNQNGCPVR